MIIALITSIICILMDQALKYWTVQVIPLHSHLQAWPGVFDWYYLQNTGASWGMLANQTGGLIIVSVLIIGLICYHLWKKSQDLQPISFLAYGLIVGGASGNLIDRLLHGYVIDMIRLSFIDFPVFNLADSFVCLGAVLLLLIVVLDWDEEVI
ncbi:signal peptidase II [Hutsoniella sourekii]|uniref:signal peptidase II n=1 Tax=Hutsoniella sourekii TaxID=87650 RepID=UPI0004842B5A|nr:signal peptidase II [Hutsoniella sourekii]